MASKASRSVSLSSSFCPFLPLHLHPVLLGASHQPPAARLPPPKPLAVRSRLHAHPRAGRSGAPARPHTHATSSQAPHSGRPHSSRQKRIPAKGAAPASALPLPGTRRALKLLAAAAGSVHSAPAPRSADTRAPPRRQPGTPSAQPGAAHPSPVPPPAVPPRHSAPLADAEPLRDPAGSGKGQHAGTRRSRLPPVAPGPAAMAGGRRPGPPG